MNRKSITAYLAALLLLILVFNVKGQYPGYNNLMANDTVTLTPEQERRFNLPVDTPKLYTVSFTEQEWNQRLYGLELIKGELKRSDLPAKNVAYMTDSVLSKIQSEVITQIRAQVQQSKSDTAYKKQHK